MIRPILTVCTPHWDARADDASVNTTTYSPRVTLSYFRENTTLQRYNITAILLSTTSTLLTKDWSPRTTIATTTSGTTVTQKMKSPNHFLYWRNSIPVIRTIRMFTSDVRLLQSASEFDSIFSNAERIRESDSLRTDITRGRTIHFEAPLLGENHLDCEGITLWYF